MKDNPLLLTVDQAAQLMQISRDLAYELVRGGKLPHVRFGRVIRVPRFGLEQWIAREARVAPPEPPEPPAPTSLSPEQQH